MLVKQPDPLERLSPQVQLPLLKQEVVLILLQMRQKTTCEIISQPGSETNPNSEELLSEIRTDARELKYECLCCQKGCRDKHKLSIVPSVYFQICGPDAALVPTVRPETEARRVFAVTALQPRNALPLEIIQATSVLRATLLFSKVPLELRFFNLFTC